MEKMAGRDRRDRWSGCEECSTYGAQTSSIGARWLRGAFEIAQISRQQIRKRSFSLSLSLSLFLSLSLSLVRLKLRRYHGNKFSSFVICVCLCVCVHVCVCIAARWLGLFCSAVPGLMRNIYMHTHTHTHTHSLTHSLTHTHSHTHTHTHTHTHIGQTKYWTSALRCTRLLLPCVRRRLRTPLP